MNIPKQITGYDIIIHWSDGEKEDVEEYGQMPCFKNVDDYLNKIQEEVNERF
jgi:hypothetical protein